MGWSAFAPQGKSLTIAVTTASSTPLQCPSGGNTAAINYRVSNASAQGCFLAHGPNSGIFAEIGVAGAQTRGQWIPGNSTEVFTYGAGSWFAAIGAAATTLYITPGDGL